MSLSMSPRRRRAATTLGSLAVVASLGVATAGSAAARTTPIPSSLRHAAATTLTKVDDCATTTTPAALRYVGGWQTTTGGYKYKNTDHRTAQANATVAITYTGTRIRLYGPKGSVLGKASVSVDGGPSTVLDSYRYSLQEQSFLYMSPLLPQGQHKAVITMLGQHNPASGGNTWALDRVEVVSNATTTAKVPAAVVTKASYGGLYGTTEADRTRRGVNQLWLKVKWADLEPQQGVYNWTPITSKLAANPNLVLRVHVNGGPSAPQWLKNSAGTVQVSNNKDQFSATVGKYWTPQYITAYKQFVTAMGTQFDTNSRVASINMFGTSLIYDEPWITGGTTSGATLYNAGLNKDKVIAAQNADLAATVAAFPHTMVEMPLHGQFTYPVAGGQAGKWSDGVGLANSWDSLYGNRVIFTDYGLGAGEYTPAAATLATAPNLYSWMHKRADLGRPIAFQATLAPGVAAGSANPTSAAAIDAADGAVRMGARWFEHHSWSLLTVAQAQAFDAGLKANVR